MLTAQWAVPLAAPLIPRLSAILSSSSSAMSAAGAAESSLPWQGQQGKGEAGRQSMFESQFWHCLVAGCCLSYSTSLSGSSTPLRRSNANSAIDALPTFPLNPIRVFEHTGSLCAFTPNGRHPWLRLPEPRTSTHCAWEFTPLSKDRECHIYKSQMPCSQMGTASSVSSAGYRISPWTEPKLPHC